MANRAWQVMENEAGQGRARQGKARQGKSRHGRGRQGGAGQGRAFRSFMAGHGGTGGARQDKTR
jgi:hypothetical protein